MKKSIFTPIITCDYTDGSERNTSFSLCRMEKGELRSAAAVQFIGERAIILCEKALSPRSQAIIRLARVYRGRSVPQMFAKMPSPFIA